MFEARGVLFLPERKERRKYYIRVGQYFQTSFFCTECLVGNLTAQRELAQHVSILLTQDHPGTKHHNIVSRTCEEAQSLPVQISSPFLCTASLQYVPKILFTIECLITNKTKKALHNETIILNSIGVDPINHSLSN